MLPYTCLSRLKPSLFYLKTDELMTIVEYCRHGNLRRFLTKYRQNFVNQIVDDIFILEENNVYDR